MSKRVDLMPLIKAFGRQDYLIDKDNWRQKILEHPLIKQCWTTGRFFLMLSNTESWKQELVIGDSLGISGYTHDEILENPEFPMFFTHPDHLGFNLQVVRNAMAYLFERPFEERSLIFVTYFYKGIAKDGRHVTIQHQSIPLVFDERHTPFIFANILTDITYLAPADLPRATVINRSTNTIFHWKEDHFEMKPIKEIFTAREREVIQELIGGKTSREIADHLNISYETVRTHRRNILRKAGVKSMGNFIVWWLRYGRV